MSNDGMRPCAEPKVCGVQNHYDGTVCRARGGDRSSDLTRLAGQGGVKPSVSLGRAQGNRVNIRDSENRGAVTRSRTSSRTTRATSLALACMTSRQTAMATGRSLRRAVPEHAARSDEVFDDMDADDYKSFFRKDNPGRTSLQRQRNGHCQDESEGRRLRRHHRRERKRAIPRTEWTDAEGCRQR